MKLAMTIFLLSGLSGTVYGQEVTLEKTRTHIDFNSMIDRSSDRQKSLEGEVSIEISAQEAHINDKFNMKEDQEVIDFIEAELHSGEIGSTAEREPNSTMNGESVSIVLSAKAKTPQVEVQLIKAEN